MVTIAAPGAKTVPTFPAEAVSSALRHELLTAVRRRYRRKGTALPKSDDEVVIMTIDIDSLTVVELLSSLDDILPFEVSESVVKAGGYGSIDAAVKHLTDRIAKKWAKHHSGEKV